MKKSNPVDEFIRIMEEVVREIQNGGTPVFIDVSIHRCQNVPQEIIVQKKNNVSVDILETNRNIHALVELPGMEEKDIALSCNGRVLEVRACKEGNIKNETIDLPARVNKTGMKATFENGVLEVVFNKSKKRKLKDDV